jgi:hypothetical protein
LDAGGIVESSTVDGIHLDEDSHRALAAAIAEEIKDLFGKRQPGLLPQRRRD